jgi:hypothetical protein
VPNLIDRNVIWNMDGPGIFGGDSSFQLYLHNLIGRVQREPMQLFCHTDRSVGTRKVTCIGNRVAGIVFVDPPAHRVDEADNTLAGNVVVRTAARGGLDLTAWQARGFDTDVRELRGTVELSDTGVLRWDWDTDLSASLSSAQIEVGTDLFGRPWPGNGSAVGPLPLPGCTGTANLIVAQA